MKKTIYLAAVASMALLTVVSCKKEKPTVNNTPTEKKGITISVLPYWNGTQMEMKKMAYTKADGEVISLRTWGMILAKLSLIREDDSAIMLGDGYQWIDFATKRTTFNYPNVPAGNYKGIRFQLGPDSLINHGDPALWPADHPLNGNLTGLHWGWAGGYIFQAFDGEFKDSANATSTKGFSFHTAGDQYRTTFFLPFSFSLESQHKIATLHFNADEYFKTPNDIKLGEKSSSHSQGTEEEALMSKLISNANEVYEIKEVK